MLLTLSRGCLETWPSGAGQGPPRSGGLRASLGMRACEQEQCGQCQQGEAVRSPVERDSLSPCRQLPSHSLAPGKSHCIPRAGSGRGLLRSGTKVANHGHQGVASSASVQEGPGHPSTSIPPSGCGICLHLIYLLPEQGLLWLRSSQDLSLCEAT